MTLLRLSALAAAFTLCAASADVYAQAVPAKAKPAPAASAAKQKQPDLEQGIEQMFAATAQPELVWQVKPGWNA